MKKLYRVVRVLEYRYPDKEAAERDRLKWGVQVRVEAPNISVRSTIVSEYFVSADAPPLTNVTVANKYRHAPRAWTVLLGYTIFMTICVAAFVWLS